MSLKDVIIVSNVKYKYVLRPSNPKNTYSQNLNDHQKTVLRMLIESLFIMKINRSTLKSTQMPTNKTMRYLVVCGLKSF